jgi:hypothetical protein
MPTPEQLARRNIDALLAQCGWIVVVIANSSVITGNLTIILGADRLIAGLPALKVEHAEHAQ